jgi:hemerythrin
MEAIRVSAGIHLVRIPEAGLCVLCGCPPDVVKTLMKRGYIQETSKDGVAYETGPDAILLSDVTVQAGTFCNMAEFPILQMFYRQGMILPKHPNNSGRKPIIAGLSSQIHAQAKYIHRGTFGLSDEKEMLEAGLKPDAAAEIMAYKRRFAGESNRRPEDVIDFIPVDSEPVPLRGGATIERSGLNRYVFRHGEQSVEVDLNLGPGESYEAPVKLGFHKVGLEYFSVLHVGEGDGWDKDRPCMSSIVIFQGKFYLIDTGPNILNSLTALGISVNEIEGIFLTHAHDDHFAGLTSLVRADHRIKYFSAPLVRASVMKKLSALMSLPERSFANTFEFRDLRFNTWNNIDGLEVMPVLSLHPVETSVLLFRALWQGGYKTYTHLADIPSLKVMDDFLLKAPGASGLAARIRDDLSDAMFAPADLKKVDIGGGLIHGEAADFKGDISAKIVLSHTSSELTATQKEIGSNAAFGAQDALIESSHDYLALQARRHLGSHFPEAAAYDLDMLLNCPTSQINAGEFIVRKGSKSQCVCLIVNGVAEVIDAANSVQRMASAGTFVGELAALEGSPQASTYRAKSYVTVLQIPSDLYAGFVKRNFDLAQTLDICKRTIFLENTWLLGEMVSSTVQNRIARSVREGFAPAGSALGQGEEGFLYLLKSGKASVTFEGNVVDEAGPGDFFGEECVFFQRSSLMEAVAAEDCRYFAIPAKVLEGIPIAAWKLVEVYERRLATFGSLFSRRATP